VILETYFNLNNAKISCKN